VDRRKKIAVVGVVLAAGLAGALEFRRVSPRAAESTGADSGWHAAPPRDFSGNFATQSQAPVGHSVDGSNAAAAGFAGNFGAPPNGNQTGTIDPGGMSAPTEAERQMLAGNSNGIAQPTGVVNPLRSPSVTPPGENPLRSAAVEPRITTPLVSVAETDQIHTVVDGDTLVKLAQHYLGSGDRYLELFQYNRDVLNDPDVLPIGAEVRIPSRAPDADTLAAVAAARPASGPLVPAMQPSAFPPPQMPQQQPPAAVANSLVGPQRGAALPAAAAQAGKPAARTYTVQAGDSLIDISRKVYGDGRHADALLQANRKLLHSPADLKPGVVLVVP
jgi:nucleoid-associated protein YgaU